MRTHVDICSDVGQACPPLLCIRLIRTGLLGEVVSRIPKNWVLIRIRMAVEDLPRSRRVCFLSVVEVQCRRNLIWCYLPVSCFPLGPTVPKDDDQSIRHIPAAGSCCPGTVYFGRRYPAAVRCYWALDSSFRRALETGSWDSSLVGQGMILDRQV